MKEQIEEIKKILYWHVGAVNCTDADFERCAKDLATRYRKQSEWISVEDRLPEMYEDVLCYRGYAFDVDFICTDGTWCEDGIFTEKVTHWMPLPQPPEMKGGAE